MNTPFSVLKISALVTSTLLLSACIDDDNDSSDHAHDSHEDHAHSLMITQANTDALSVLEEGEAESLGETAAANGATLLLSNTGEQAAIVTAGTVQFVATHHEEEEGEEAHDEEHDEEEHELPEVSALSISGSDVKVANTNGHFSVLANGTTQFVPYEVLEKENPTAEDAEGVSYSVTEDYPALLLDEDHDLVLAFHGGNAVAYEGATLEETLFVCEEVESTVQTAEFVVVSCKNAGGDTNYAVTVAEANDVHTITSLDLEIAADVEWKSRADVFVGVSSNTFYVLEENTQGALEQESTFTVAGLCTWGIDSQAADIFALTATELKVLGHDGTESAGLALDESTGQTCEDLTIATASQAVFVLDNATPKLYEIDKEEGAALYHIHGREDLSVNDVASAISFHEVGEEATHDHAHD